MQYLQNMDHQHHKWQPQKSWISFPDCQDAQDKQLTQYQLKPKIKMEDAPKLLKIPKSECPDIWIPPPRHKWPKSWSSMEDPVVPLERNLYGHPWAGLLWERLFEKVPLEHVWEKVPNWKCLFVNREKEKGLFLSVYVDDRKLARKKQNIDPMWKTLMKDVDLGDPTSFLDHVYLGCTQRECQTSKDIVDNHMTMFDSWISARALEQLPSTGNLTRPFPHGPMTWKVMQRNEWKENANRHTKQLNSCTKYQLHALTTVNSKRRNGICWRMVKHLLTDCSEMPVFGAHW